MSVLITISFIAVFIVCSKFLYKKLLTDIKEIKSFNRDVIKALKNLDHRVSEYKKGRKI